MLVAQHVLFAKYVVKLINVYGNSIVHISIIDSIFRNFKRFNTRIHR